MSGGPNDPGGPPGRFGGEFGPQKYHIGMWVALAGILMLFAALISAYIIRQTKGLGENLEPWQPVALPALLWINTAALVASSVSIEVARRSLARGGFVAFNRWMLLTTSLGAAFLAGQIVAWRQLAAQGVYLNSSPHSSFFYVLTSLHGVHLLGGVIALGYVTLRGLRYDFGPARRTAVDVTALYWHFMDGLWVFLFLLLFFWR
jgi:cytochrome c oxidase subunit 3